MKTALQLRKIYIAGMFSTKELRKEQALSLMALGHTVTSHWIDETVPHTVTMKDLPNQYHQETALCDVSDIDDSDLFIEFVPTYAELVDAPVSSVSRGGRHWEMGYAWAKGKEIWVCGPKENIFHHLPERVHHFFDFMEILKALGSDR